MKNTGIFTIFTAALRSSTARVDLLPQLFINSFFNDSWKISSSTAHILANNPIVAVYVVAKPKNHRNVTRKTAKK